MTILEPTKNWFRENILDLFLEIKISFFPPLMVYMAAGISGLTSIVGTFYVKERLGLSAEFLAALGFWAGLPWALKMPVGHLIDLIWKWKGLIVYLGASLIAASLSIMIMLLSHTQAMSSIATLESWFVLATLLAPIGYVLQDVVADAMTVEAVPRVETDGSKINAHRRKSMHTTMQTLGRVAIIGGGIFVAIINMIVMRGVNDLSEFEKAEAYLFVYQLGLIIPIVSILGVILAEALKRRDKLKLQKTGLSDTDIKNILERGDVPKPDVNWWILGGGLGFSLITISIGLGNFSVGQEVIFCLSMIIVIFLISRIIKELDTEAQKILVGTAILIFVYRAMPTPGAGATWWMIDELKFDQEFLARLSFIAACLALVGMFIFRRFMAEKSITYVIGFLTVAGTILSIPIIGMYFGLHEWTARLTNGVIDARFIAMIDTALESPLGQVAMIPMLAWIANSAPEKLKATFFAIMASFANLALSASQLGTKYLNQFFTVSREVSQNGEIVIPANYSELGLLLISASIIGFCIPMLAILYLRFSRFKNA
ncbi:MAG: hypothetical protein CMK56_07205 [Proteobacteria bacterium]|nr:hypothetical protein [Pseudomonadota bacterium]